MPNFEQAYPPKDTVDPYTHVTDTTYGSTCHFTPLLVASSGCSEYIKEKVFLLIKRKTLSLPFWSKVRIILF